MRLVNPALAKGGVTLITEAFVHRLVTDPSGGKVTAVEFDYQGERRTVSAKVFVGKKQVKVIRGRRLTAKIKLTGLRKGRFHVKVVSKLASGLTSVDERTYRTCTLNKKKKPKA